LPGFFVEPVGAVGGAADMAFDPDVEFGILLHGFNQIEGDEGDGQWNSAAAVKDDVLKDDGGAGAGGGAGYGSVNGAIGGDRK
jgi:hypothetical protein